VPALALSFAAHKRSAFPDVATVNCLVEADPTSPSEPLALIARPGLGAFKQVGTAPIRLVFQKDGLFDNAALVVASNTLHTLSAGAVSSAYVGTLAGDGLLEADAGLDADYNSVVRLATGSALYKAQSDTGTVVLEDFPVSGGAGATSVAFFGGYWLGTEAGSDAVYYQNPAEADWNALQFASAEYAPDPNVCVRAVGEVAWFLGRATLEGWRLTGDASSPLEPVGGLKFDIGCRAAPAAVNCRGTLIFVDNDCAVRMTSGGEPSIICPPGLIEQIRRASPGDLRASFVVKDGHPLYVLTIGVAATWIYDLSTRAWTRANSNETNYWRADLFCNIGDLALARDALSNQVYRLDPDLLDDAGDTFTMEFTAYLEAKERPVPIANVELHCETGGAPRTGQGSDPKVVMQISRDGAKTWGPGRERGLGATGEYLQRVRWAGLGMALAPWGAWFRFYISDPVVRRVSGVSANVP
jgi:hypothetical protein